MKTSKKPWPLATVFRKPSLRPRRSRRRPLPCSWAPSLIPSSLILLLFCAFYIFPLFLIGRLTTTAEIQIATAGEARPTPPAGAEPKAQVER